MSLSLPKLIQIILSLYSLNKIKNVDPKFFPDPMLAQQTFTFSKSTIDQKKMLNMFKGMLGQNIEHFLKKRQYKKLGFSETN